jgi:hypothetical protein
VFLLRRNMKTKQPCDKLDYKKLGFFKIEKQIEPLNFKLKLLKAMRIYSIFYITLLKKAS